LPLTGRMGQSCLATSGTRRKYIQCQKPLLIKKEWIHQDILATMTVWNKYVSDRCHAHQRLHAINGINKCS
jgi:hypothetical protein